MRTLREFRFRDFEKSRDITIPAGAELDQETVARLSANRVDVEKMVRTKYLEQESLNVTETPAAPVKKRRGRPPKQKSSA